MMVGCAERKADNKAKLAVIGAGLVGKKHIALIRQSPICRLFCVVDPADKARQLAAEIGVDWFSSVQDMCSQTKIDGAIVATPNQFHVDHGLLLISNGIPLLMEKPLASDVAGACQLVNAATAANIPLLTGHHRRHNPLIQKAKDMIEDGQIGRPVSLSMTCWLMKPDPYFEAEWRTKKGAGPIYINLIHDLDLARHFLGDVKQVMAMQSSATRGFEVEDTAVILLKFVNGALGTINLSDTITSPWSWELSSGENHDYPTTTEYAYMVGGSAGSLAVPNLSLWAAEQTPSWWEPIKQVKPVYQAADPLVRQLEQFVGVVNGQQSPLVTGADGLASLILVEAVKRAAETGQTVQVADVIG
jgi:predicted dehydrogenase